MSKDKSSTKRVFPVEGRFLLGVPHIVQDISPKEAEYLVETGAFSFTPSAEPALEAEEQE